MVHISKWCLSNCRKRNRHRRYVSDIEFSKWKVRYDHTYLQLQVSVRCASNSKVSEISSCTHCHNVMLTARTITASVVHATTSHECQSLTSKAGTLLSTVVWNGLLTGADTAATERLLGFAAQAESNAESNGSNGWLSIGLTPDEFVSNGRLALTVGTPGWRAAADEAICSPVRTGVEMKLGGCWSAAATEV